MALTLTIENMTSLPDGGPLSVTVQGTRGIDIGRDQYLDWTLPDPSRFISGRHCEIRWRDGAYWLHDISTNGTFLDGEDGRLKGPHRLRNGDRFLIGHYVIVAMVMHEEGLEPARTANEAALRSTTPDYDQIWDPVGDVAPPVNPKQLKAPRDLQPVKPDFLEWAMPVAPGPAPAAMDDMSWAQGPAPAPPAPAPAPSPTPTPRRPVWVTGEPDGPWAAPASEALAQPSPERSSTPPASAGDAAALLRLIARSAGMPEDTFAARSPDEVARELGQLMRLVAEDMKQLLEARQQAKRLARSSDHTTVQALDNNPLKFAPTIDDAMRIMFGPSTPSYLSAPRAFAQGFADLKAHQVKTFSAMQQALTRLMEEFDPEIIEKTAPADRGLLAAMGSQKARLWDLYVARWRARSQSQKEGLLKAFMTYFAECYDSDGNRVS